MVKTSLTVSDMGHGDEQMTHIMRRQIASATDGA